MFSVGDPDSFTSEPGCFNMYRLWVGTVSLKQSWPFLKDTHNPRMYPNVLSVASQISTSPVPHALMYPDTIVDAGI